MSTREGSGAAPGAPNVFGKYALVERIGFGGMAEVWTARVHGPAGFQRTVVVKRTLQHLNRDPQFAKMFVDEARLSARLTHPNIAQVYELGEVAGEYFLAMEYVSGRDLATILRQLDRLGRRPPPAFAAMVVRDIARALSYAHRLCDEAGQPLRIIHRDVTPSNIMVSFDGAIKLVDFGIAKALASAEERTQTGTLKGKFSYMAPEHIEGEVVDHRADLFSLGVVLHEMLTMRRLFKGAHDLETIANVRRTAVAPPSQTNADVPPELDAICLKALARDRDARYQSGDELALALESVVHRDGFGPDRVRELMRELFGDERSAVAREPAASAASAPTVDAKPPTPVVAITRMAALGRWRRVAVIAGTAAVVGAVIAIGWTRLHPREASVTAPVGARVAAGPTVANPENPPVAVAPSQVAAAPSPVAAAPSQVAAAPSQVAAAPSQVAAAPSPVAAAPSQVAAAPSQVAVASVRVDVESRPRNADIFVDGERRPRGRTPATLRFDASPARHRVRLVLSGHRVEELGFVADRDVRIETTLVRLPERNRRSHAPPHPPASRPTDDVADPFR